MSKVDKPFAVGMLDEEVSTVEGHAGIEFLKSLGLKCKTSFLKDHQPYKGYTFVDEKAEFFYIQYNNITDNFSERITNFIKDAKISRKKIYLLYKRKIDDTYHLYNFTLHDTTISFGSNVTNYIIQVIKDKYNKTKQKTPAWRTIPPADSPQLVRKSWRVTKSNNELDIPKLETIKEPIFPVEITKRISQVKTVLLIRRRRLK
jgi:hypothetical protein